MTCTIELPWPPAALSPNSRRHWRVLANVKHQYREACRLCVLASVRGEPELGSGRIPVSITFCPPDRRSYDLDNLHARIKAGLDGMCDALGVNDRQFRPVTVDFGEVVKGGAVRVALAAARAVGA